VSLFRRAGAGIAKFLRQTTDPAAIVDQVQLYAKLASGVTHLFARRSDGTIDQLTGASGGGGGTTPARFTWMEDFINNATSNMQVITPGSSTEVKLVDSSFSGPNGWAKTPIGVLRFRVDSAGGAVEVYVDIAPVTGHVDPAGPILGEIANDITQGVLTLEFRLSWQGDDEASGSPPHVGLAFGQYTQPASGFSSRWNLLGFGINKDAFGNNHWWALTGNAGGGVDSLIQHDTGVAIDNLNFHPHVFKVVCDPAGPLTQWYIDGTLVATDSTAQFGSLLPSMNMWVATGQTVDVFVDYIFCDFAVDRTTL